jgi:hypothetical protein
VGPVHCRGHRGIRAARRHAFPYDQTANHYDPVLKLADERGYWSVVAHHKHPITEQDYANYPGRPEAIRVTREVTQPPVLVHTDSGYP